jgi:hypothetical protein
MNRRWILGLLALPVLTAAWLIFATAPVNGLPLDELAMFELPGDEQVADAGAGAEPVAEPVTPAGGADEVGGQP